MTSAEPVANPIERGLAAPGLLAYVLVSKYAEHLPLYRQQDVLARHGIFLARSTLSDWLAQCAGLLRPLVELMQKRILRSHVIQADETPVQVLDSTRDSTRTGYFWAYIGDGDHPYTVYDYRDERGQEGPAKVLRNYCGYLQTDAYLSALLTALSSNEVDLESLMPDAWIAAHPEHLLQYRRDEAEAAAIARRRRDAGRMPRDAAEAREIAAVLAGGVYDPRLRNRARAPGSWGFTEQDLGARAVHPTPSSASRRQRARSEGRLRPVG